MTSDTKDKERTAVIRISSFVNVTLCRFRCSQVGRTNFRSVSQSNHLAVILVKKLFELKCICHSFVKMAGALS